MITDRALAEELQPTEENIAKTFEEDRFDRDYFLFSFIDSILNTDAHSVSLNGKWGTGKTFFIKQAKLVLDIENPSCIKHNDNELSALKKTIRTVKAKREMDWKPVLSVYYDAWANDNDVDPVLSIIYRIMEGLGIEDLPPASFDKGRLKKILPEIAKTCLNMTKINGINLPLGWIVDIFNSDDPLAKIVEQKKLQAQITEFFDCVIKERGEKLIIFIDELDRCNPNFAVRLLERVKHYFTSDNVLFVVATNVEQLQHTVKKHYGNDFDATVYLNRFFDDRYDLPIFDIDDYFSKYFVRTNANYYCMCRDVVKYFKFSFREIVRYVRMATRIFDPQKNNSYNYSVFHDNNITLRMCCETVIPIMVALKITNIEQYNSFIEGKAADVFVKIMTSAGIRDYTMAVFSVKEEDISNNKMCLEQICNKVYELIFVKQYDSSELYEQFNNYKFSKYDKDYLLTVISGLSKERKIPEIHSELEAPNNEA